MFLKNWNWFGIILKISLATLIVLKQVLFSYGPSDVRHIFLFLCPAHPPASGNFFSLSLSSTSSGVRQFLFYFFVKQEHALGCQSSSFLFLCQARLRVLGSFFSISLSSTPPGVRHTFLFLCQARLRVSGNFFSISLSSTPSGVRHTFLFLCQARLRMSGNFFSISLSSTPSGVRHAIRIYRFFCKY